MRTVVADLTLKSSRLPGVAERRRRAEALRRHRAEARGQSMDETAYLRAQLRLAARLTARLAAKGDPEEMAALVVEELHETFAFYLAAVQRLDHDGVLRLIAGRGPLADVMTEFLVTEQPVSEGINGRVARSGATALVPDTRADPDYLVRDAKTDPRSQLSVAVLLDGAVWGVLNIEAAEAGGLDEGDAALVETIAAGLGAALHRARLLAELEGAFTTALAALTDAVEAKDLDTAKHSAEVADLAERVALRMSLTGAEAHDVRSVALLHDIGKIGVPSEILLKPTALSEEEWVTMRAHAAIGGELVASIEVFSHLAAAVRATHERWDGGGYPDGLAGAAIPLAARVVAACDTYCAIVTDRPYRAARSRLQACVELLRVAGSQLDRQVVEALVGELGLN